MSRWTASLVFALALGLGATAQAGEARDATGATVVVKDPKRIVTLGATVGELVYALGLADQIVAADASTAGFSPLKSRATLGYNRQVSPEGVLAAGPDLVLAAASSGPESALNQIRDAGVPVFVVDDTASLDAAQQRARTLGTLLDHADKGQELAKRIDAEVQAAAGPPSGLRVLFIYARGAGTLMVAGQDTAADAMLGLAGAQNALQGHSGYLPLTPEAVLGAAPDVLLLTTHGLQSVGGADTLLKQPGLSILASSGALPVVAMDDVLLLGFGPRLGEAVTLLQQTLAESR